MIKQKGILSIQILWLLLPFPLYSQIVFTSTSHDFGVLSNWSQTPAIFEYENTGSTKEAFLNAVRPANVYIKYPNTYIQPGEKGLVLIYFEPLTIGRFNEKIKLFVSNPKEAVEFNIRGNVNSYLECPGVNLPADKNLLVTDQKGMVINAITKEVIPDANLRFTNSEGKSRNIKANRQGHFNLELMLGMYHILVTSEGYHDFDEMMYLNKNTPELIFELMPRDPGAPVDKKPEKEVQVTATGKELPFTIEGMVLDDSTGMPVNKASVTLYHMSLRVSYFYKTLADGKYTKRLEAGKYLITCTANNYITYTDTFTFTPQHAEKTIRLQKDPNVREVIIIPEYYVKGFTLDAETLMPLEDAKLYFYNENNRLTMAASGKGGAYSVLLLPGTYRVDISASDYEAVDSLKLTVKNELENNNYYLTAKITKAPVDMQEDKPKVIFLETEDKLDIEPDSIPGIVYIETPEVVSPEDYLNPDIYIANNIVFLIDVSSSMEQYHKMEHLKIAMIRLVEVLRDIDHLTLISFAARQTVHFIFLPSDKKDTIINTIQSLQPYGMTYGLKGLGIAYELARDKFITGGNNQVIIATDGNFNSPEHSEIELMRMIRKYAREGIILSIIGFGNDEDGINRMRAMAALGNGKLILIKTDEQAKHVLIEEIKQNSFKK